VLRGEEHHRVLKPVAVAALIAALGGANPVAGQAPSPGGDVAFIADFAPSHARVRRDTFDEPNWSGGDSFMKGIAKAEAHECTVALYTRGAGQDFKIEVDFHHPLTLTRRSTPETLVFEGPEQAMRYWQIKWDHDTPAVTPGDATPLASLLLGLSNRDAGERLSAASERALAACGGAKAP